MLRKQLGQMNHDRGKLDEKRKEEEFSQFIARTNHEEKKPTPDTNNQVIFNGIRPTATSHLASIGVVDNRAYHEDARKWLRENELHIDADKAFSGIKAPSHTPKQWNDSSIPDSDFAADEEIIDTRQVSAQRPFVPRSSNFR